jgi:hypothetical protein
MKSGSGGRQVSKEFMARLIEWDRQERRRQLAFAIFVGLCSGTVTYLVLVLAR